MKKGHLKIANIQVVFLPNQKIFLSVWYVLLRRIEIIKYIFWTDTIFLIS